MLGGGVSLTLDYLASHSYSTGTNHELWSYSRASNVYEMLSVALERGRLWTINTSCKKHVMEGRTYVRVCTTQSVL